MSRKRAADAGAYLLTGATGFLGSHIMAGLLKKGERVVVLGRPAAGASLAERIRRLLRWFAIEPLAERLESLEADLLKPGLGLGADDHERLRRRGLPVIHCASDTRFAEKNRDAVLAANVGSLVGVLDLARSSGGRGFHFLSSAYAAGIDHSECPEAPVRSLRFTNVYEQSKALAEQVVQDTCRSAGIPFTIIRPAIVYGDSRNGRSLKFNALYHPVRSLQQLRDIYAADIAGNNGRKSAPYGIRLDGRGTLHLPIRIFIPRQGKINLIPVDYFTAAMLAILERPGQENFFHITSHRPAGMGQLAAFSERFLGLSGIEVVVGAAGAGEMRNPAEELFDLFIKPYRPYIADDRVFLRQNTDRATGGALPPELDYETFRRCMAFAVAADWGRKPF
jgi:nucleoside-diphosphate-sugar epimerase